MIHRLVLYALIVLALAGCGRGVPGPAATPTAEPAGLEGTEWVGVSIDGRAVLPGTTVTLNFKDGQASGVSGCNSYGGAYTVSGSTLTLAQVASTLMLCLEPPGVMEQEKAFQEVLSGRLAYRRSGERLEITTPTGDRTLVLALKPRFDMDPADLPGTRWQLVSIDGQAPGVRPPITLVFEDAGRASGFAGCRGYEASYQAEGDAIAFPFLQMIDLDCPSPPAIEGRYTDALSTATNYRLAEGRLEILTTRHGVLVFEAVGE